MEQIGTKIQFLRKNKNMTQAQLAEVLSVSAQSVSKWENHQSVPDISLLPMIARYFGITMDELFNYRLDALNYRERFIRFMADNGVLQFGSFRLQSGRISPYYINTANYTSASQISKLGEFYAECLRENNVEADLLMGDTPPEIPLLISTCMMLYNRYGADIRYCTGHSISAPDSRITLIKNTLTSGRSLQNSLQKTASGCGVAVSDVIVSVDRMERYGASPLSARYMVEKTCGVRIHAVVQLDDIIRAVEKGITGTPDIAEAMKQYKKTYGGIYNDADAGY